jgi:hypothetical protein
MTHNEEMWSLLVGFFLPPFIAVIQQPSWPKWARAVATLVVCVAVGLVTVLLSGKLTGQSAVSGSLMVLVSSLVTYQHWWKHTGVTAKIEHATSTKP